MASYDVAKVSVIFGPAQIQGFSDGSAVKIEYNSDLWTTQVGVDGAFIRSKSNDLSAKITFSLQASSFSNVILQAAFAADLAGLPGGALPLVILDGATATIHETEAAWVMKDPGRDYQKESQPIEWVLECGKMLTVHGFSPTLT